MDLKKILGISVATFALALGGCDEVKKVEEKAEESEI